MLYICFFITAANVVKLNGSFQHSLERRTVKARVSHCSWMYLCFYFLCCACIYVCASTPVSHSSHYTFNHPVLTQKLCRRRRVGKGESEPEYHRVLCGCEDRKENQRVSASWVSSRSGWWSASFSGCKSRWQILGRLAFACMKIRAVALATGGERLFKRNILSFSLIHCSWRIRTLLLNSSFYGYQRLYRQPLPEAPRSAHPQPATPHPPLLLLLFFYCCIHNTRPAHFLWAAESRIFSWNLCLLLRIKHGVLVALLAHFSLSSLLQVSSLSWIHITTFYPPL